MSGHVRSNPSGGHLFRNSSNGHLVRCSCTCDEFDTYTCVISGVTGCVCGAEGVGRVTLDRDVNGTYTLSQVDGCTASAGTTWQFTENSATVFARTYSNCANPPTTTATGLKITLQYFGVLFGGPSWSLTVQDFAGTRTAFSNTAAFVSCASRTFTNAVTDCTLAANTGKNGSATVTGDV